jgi:dodecin
LARVTETTAASSKSFEDAIVSGIERANETLENVKGAWVQQTVAVEGGKITRAVKLAPKSAIRAQTFQRPAPRAVNKPGADKCAALRPFGGLDGLVRVPEARSTMVIDEREARNDPALIER